ncbi:hypothetical protein E4T47_06934 [Aureobasidium subglaciale]|nr:hypothetical protein E4T47_06934 [Aureobasidium subglaciale]
MVYGLSKDFAAGGLRLGCLYSKNTELLNAISAVGQFAWSGSLNQLFAAEMLEDEEWLNAFLDKSRGVLKERYGKCRAMLDNYGIEYQKGVNAGFFVWAEKALVAKMEAEKIYITQGSLLQSEEAGWFRIIYSQEDEVLEEGFRRLFIAIGAEKNKEKQGDV